VLDMVCSFVACPGRLAGLPPASGVLSTEGRVQTLVLRSGLTLSPRRSIAATMTGCGRRDSSLLGR
jgi:hypothetical protein